MPNNSENTTKTSVNVRLGENIDAALGDVLRALLLRPSEAAGDLLTDGLGLLGDQLKRKRAINAALGLEEARTQLERKGVALEDLRTPEDEELYTVINGMSLTPDKTIRKLWSGLLASAVSPDEDQVIERPITSAIDALSPSDAKIIDFIAYVKKEQDAIDLATRQAAGLPLNQLLSVGRQEAYSQARKSFKPRIKKLLEDVARITEEFQLSDVVAHSGWADNLIRLGLLEVSELPEEILARRFTITSLNERDLVPLLNSLEQRVAQAEHGINRRPEPKVLYRIDPGSDHISFGLSFTRFGYRFIRACGLL